MEKGTRWSGADWASETKEIVIVGVGGIGSWLALSLSRIGHTLILIDEDTVDETNVSGGQMYAANQVGEGKVYAVEKLCREFGATQEIITLGTMFNKGDIPPTSIVITGLDNMKARKDVYNGWKEEYGLDPGALFMDGRLLIENSEVFTIQGGDHLSMKEYEKNWLFDDSEVAEQDCTLKQSTFAAMGIAALMTATLCNWLTNWKLEAIFREVPFHQRMYYPALDYKKEEVEKVEHILVEEETVKV